jgi:hypothetical protein
MQHLIGVLKPGIPLFLKSLFLGLALEQHSSGFVVWTLSPIDEFIPLGSKQELKEIVDDGGSAVAEGFAEGGEG